MVGFVYWKIRSLDGQKLQEILQRLLSWRDSGSNRPSSTKKDFFNCFQKLILILIHISIKYCTSKLWPERRNFKNCGILSVNKFYLLSAQCWLNFESESCNSICGCPTSMALPLDMTMTRSDPITDSTRWAIVITVEL